MTSGLTAAPDRTLALPRSTRTTTTSAWTIIDTVAVVLLVMLALVPRTVNMLGLDPFIDEASTTDWAFRQFELAVAAHLADPDPDRWPPAARRPG